MVGRHKGEGRVLIVREGVGQWGGQATIMMCGCDGGWYGGDKSVSLECHCLNPVQTSELLVEVQQTLT
jgi:hypothetical protein